MTDTLRRLREAAETGKDLARTEIGPTGYWYHKELNPDAILKLVAIAEDATGVLGAVDAGIMRRTGTDDHDLMQVANKLRVTLAALDGET